MSKKPKPKPRRGLWLWVVNDIKGFASLSPTRQHRNACGIWGSATEACVCEVWLARLGITVTNTPKRWWFPAARAAKAGKR